MMSPHIHHTFYLALIAEHGNWMEQAHNRPSRIQRAYHTGGKTLVRMGHWLQARSQTNEEPIIVHNH